MRRESAPTAGWGETEGSRGPARRRGLAGWFDVRGRRLGAWAFALHRITGLLLLGYLYLHLLVLSALPRGPRAWESFLRLARTPLFLGFDVLLIGIILTHALNGIRVSLVGSGYAVTRQKALFFVLIVLGWVVLIYSAVHIFGTL